MIYFGYEESLSFFEETSIPVIFLNPDLSVKYMSSEADKAFSHLFVAPKWYKKRMSNEIYKAIVSRLSDGMTVTVSPPDINDFSMLMFVPEFRKSNKTFCVKLYIETSYNIKHYIETTNAFFGGKMSGLINSANLSLNILKRMTHNEPECRRTIETMAKINSEFAEFSNNITSLYEIASRRESSNDTVFLLREALYDAIPEAEDIKFTDLTSDNDLTIYDRQKFINIITGIITHYKLYEGSGMIHIKAYTNGDRLVIVFRGEKAHRGRFSDEIAEPFANKRTDLEIIKASVLKNGGNMVIMDFNNELKILMSLRIHIKSDYGLYLRQ